MLARLKAKLFCERTTLDILGSKLSKFDVSLLPRCRRARSSERTVLLVDADAHSIEEIQKAMNQLKGRVAMGGKVEAKLFAPPARAGNKKWGRLLSEPDVSFVPVLRSDSS